MGHEDGHPDIVQHKRLRMARTMATLFSWVCMGLFSEISGPTMPYLKERINSNYEQIGRSFLARSVGFLVGALSGGVLGDALKARTDLIMAVALTLGALPTAAAPWCPNLELLSAMFCIDGFAKGILGSVGNAYLLRIWGDKASVPVHALHFSFGIGALITPQLARPFIDETEVTNSSVTIVNGIDNTIFNTSPIPPNQTYHDNRDHTVSNESAPARSGGRNERIEIPYAIIGAITLAAAFAFVILDCRRIPEVKKPAPNLDNSGKKKKRSIKSIFSKRSLVGEYGAFGLQIVACLFFFLALPAGAERAYGKFIYSFSMDSVLKFTVSNASLLTTVFWAAFTAGRGLAVVMATRMSPSAIMFTELTLTVISASVLASCATQHPAILWVFSSLFAASLAPTFPAGIVWANAQMPLSAMVTSFCFIGAALGAMLFSWLSGYLFEYHGPMSLMYLIAGYAVGATVLFTLMYVRARLYKPKKDSTDSKAPEEQIMLENGHVTRT